MARYLQRERYLDEKIPAGGIVGFDLEITGSQTSDPDDPLKPAEDDFFYHTVGALAGAIDVLRRGDYLVMWGLEQVSERPLTMEFFHLRQWIDSPVNPRWETMGGVSTHLKAAATVGFAILSKPTDGATTVALFNESGDELHLNSFGERDSLRQKARIVFFGLSEEDGDFGRIMELIELDACCYPIDELADRIKKIALREVDQNEKMEDLQVKYVELSNEYQFLSSPPVIARWALDYRTTVDLTGFYLCCKRVGYMYYLWMEGNRTTTFRVQPNVAAGFRVFTAGEMWMYDENGQVSYPFRDNFPYATAIYGVCWLFQTNGAAIEYQFRLEPPTYNASGVDTNGGLWIRGTSLVTAINIRLGFSISLAP